MTKKRKFRDSVEMERRRKKLFASSESIAGPAESRKSLVSLQRPTIMTDHILSLGEVCHKYHTHPKRGLTTAQAFLNLKKFGPNSYKPPTTFLSRVKMFIVNAFGKFSLVLVGCSILLCINTVFYLQDHHYRAACIMIFMLVYIAFTQILKGYFNSAQKAFHKSVAEHFDAGVGRFVSVVRSGRWHMVPMDELVPGDIVSIQSGDMVPADLRILEANRLSVDNSNITGVSTPVAKTPICTDEDPMQTANLIWFGTDVLDGTCKGMVIATGIRTRLGKIETRTAKIPLHESSLHIEIDNFVTFSNTLAVILAILQMIIAILHRFTIRRVFTLFLVTLMCAMPTTLNITIRIILKLCIRRLQKTKCLIKSQRPVEILGQVSVICLDKTGTITDNNMTVSHLYYDKEIHDLRKGKQRHSESKNFHCLCRIIALTGNSEIYRQKHQLRSNTQGYFDVSMDEIAVKNVQSLTNQDAKYRNRYPQVFEIPFNSTSRFSASLHIKPYSNLILEVVKGAPEKVLKRCETILINENSYILTEWHLQNLNNVLLQLGYRGEHIIAMADRTLPPKFSKTYPFTAEPNFPTKGLRFVGFVSFIDPEKSNVSESIDKLQKAGIRPIILTGDHPITAAAIARKIGLISPDNDTLYDIALRKGVNVVDLTQHDQESCKAGVFTGEDLEKMTPGQLTRILTKFHELVLARLTPEDKFKVVKSLQKLGETVIMVGDGVNDAYAIKQADIGIAMGQQGSMVSKRAADIIIVDDNFASIFEAIKEGRLFYENLKKCIVYFLSTFVPKIVPLFFESIFKIPYLVSVQSVLLIDFTTSLLPGISMAMEEPEHVSITRIFTKHKAVVFNPRVLMHCYLHIGTVELVAGLATWLHTFGKYGFLPLDLVACLQLWGSDVNDLEDSYGIEWEFASRIKLSDLGNAAYYLAIVIVQVANALFVSRTRTSSVFTQGFHNILLLQSVVLVIFLASCCVYVPYVNNFLKFAPIHVTFLWPALAVGIYLIVFNEMRKAYIRKHPNGWVAKNTF